MTTLNVVNYKQKSLDDLSHDLQRGGAHRLSELGLTRSAAAEFLKFASFDELDLVHTSESDLQEMLNTTYILPVYNRCMWIAQPPVLVQGSHAVTVTDQQALLEAESELEKGEYEQRLKINVLRQPAQCGNVAVRAVVCDTRDCLSAGHG